MPNYSGKNSRQCREKVSKKVFRQCLDSFFDTIKPRFYAKIATFSLARFFAYIFAAMENINSKFNKELQLQIEGTLPKGHIYRLGYPGDILLSAGIENLPIELIASRLENKSNINYKNKHPFEISEIKDLPKAINSPIAIFNSTKLNDNSNIILTELKDKNGNNFVVVLKVFKNPVGNKINTEVNNIRSVYPKDRIEEIMNWIKSGYKLVKWLDKEKALNFVSTQSPYRIVSGNKEGSIII